MGIVAGGDGDPGLEITAAVHDTAVTPLLIPSDAVSEQDWSRCQLSFRRPIRFIGPVVLRA